MQRWLQKILLFVAVVTIIGHSSLPHHHHEQIEAVVQHHDHDEDHEAHSRYEDNDENKDEDDSLFSFAQLDEDFVPEKYQGLSIELPIVYLLTPVITHHYNLSTEKSKTHFGTYKEYPPPCCHPSDFNRRGPPSLLA